LSSNVAYYTHKGVLASLSKVVPTDSRPFSGAIALFPGCRGIPAWKADIPTLMLLGALDTIKPAEICEELAGAVLSGASVKVSRFS